MTGKLALTRVGFIIVKIAVSAGLLYFLFAHVDAVRMREFFSTADRTFIGLAIFLLIAQIFIHAVTWRIILASLEVPLAASTSIKFMAMGLFINQIFIASIGGMAARVFLACQIQVPLRAAFSSVLAERLIFVFVLAIVAVITSPILSEIVAQHYGERFALGYLVLVGAGCLVCGIVVAWGRRLFGPVMGIRVFRAAADFLQDVRRIFRHRRRLWQILVLAFIYFGLAFASIFLIIRALGHPVSFVDLCLLLPHVFLISTIPISVNAWGIREASMVGLLSLVGVPADVALSGSLGFGFALLVTRLPGIILWLMWRRSKPA